VPRKSREEEGSDPPRTVAVKKLEKGYLSGISTGSVVFDPGPISMI
jgi:hypothetical protein